MPKEQKYLPIHSLLRTQADLLLKNKKDHIIEVNGIIAERTTLLKRLQEEESFLHQHLESLPEPPPPSSTPGEEVLMTFSRPAPPTHPGSPIIKC